MYFNFVVILVLREKRLRMHGAACALLVLIQFLVLKRGSCFTDQVLVQSASILKSSIETKTPPFAYPRAFMCNEARLYRTTKIAHVTIKQ